MIRHAVRASSALAAALSLAACTRTSTPGDTSAESGAARTAAGVVDSTRRVATVGGFSEPEAVRYDPVQDFYFVSNFNGSGDARDNNGFISRLRADGTVERLRFAAGGVGGVTLHAPRGMTILGDTLWVCDADAVRGFDRRTGAPVATVDFSAQDVGFLNDITPGPDGALYVTDTGRDRIYRIAGRAIAVALADSTLGRPNGITWDSAGGRLIVVPYGGGRAIFAWRPGTATLDTVGTSAGAQFDGVEVLPGGRLLVASQRDSSLHLFEGGRGRAIVRTAGEPADIAVDTRRHRVAVPGRQAKIARPPP